MRISRLSAASVLLAASPVLAAGVNNTLFLHHFDAVVGSGAGNADYSNGSPVEQIGSPNGPGGQIDNVNPKFGPASIYRSGGVIGGRVEYNTSGNWNAQVGTIEMWVRGSGVTGGGFVGLWGTDTGSGSGDIRMYIYDTGAGRTLGAYMNGGTAGAGFWEIEQVIPAGSLDTTNWHNVVWEYDTAAGKTATWWDGQLLRNTPDAGVVNDHVPSNTLFHIGENQTGSAPFPGNIDEFRISDALRYDVNSNFVPASAAFAVPEPAVGSLLLGAGLCLARRRRQQ